VKADIIWDLNYIISFLSSYRLPPDASLNARMFQNRRRLKALEIY